MISATPAHWWQNWQLWTVIAAFAGFTLGNFIKFVFDHRVEKLRRKAQARSLAISLRAEVCVLSSVLWGRYANLHNAIFVQMVVEKTMGGDDVRTFHVKHTFQQFSYTIYDFQAQHLGLLPPELSAMVIGAYGLMKSSYQGSEFDLTIPISLVDQIWNSNKKMFEAHANCLGKVADALSDFVGVARPQRQQLEFTRDLSSFSSPLEEEDLQNLGVGQMLIGFQAASNVGQVLPGLSFLNRHLHRRSRKPAESSRKTFELCNGLLVRSGDVRPALAVRHAKRHRPKGKCRASRAAGRHDRCNKPLNCEESPVERSRATLPALCVP